MFAGDPNDPNMLFTALGSKGVALPRDNPPNPGVESDIDASRVMVGECDGEVLPGLPKLAWPKTLVLLPTRPLKALVAAELELNAPEPPPPKVLEDPLPNAPKPVAGFTSLNDELGASG